MRQASNAEVARMSDLLLFITLEPEQQAELNRLRQLAQPPAPVTFDSDADLDPDSLIARSHMVWRESYNRERQRNERRNALGERYYAEQSKRMNGLGFRRQ